MANDLVAIIRQKQAEVARLFKELEEAKAALSETLRDRPPSIPRPALPARTGKVQRGIRKKGPPTIRSADVLPQDSAAYWAAQAIKNAGRPMHVKDILKAADAGGHKVRMNTLVGSLSRWVERRVFYRAGPNVFGLLEMRK